MQNYDLFSNALVQHNKIILMKSLRTDDILGARPTIRHAPRNLIRDEYLSKNGYYSRDPQSLTELHMSESFLEKSPAGKPHRPPVPYEGHIVPKNSSINPNYYPQARYAPPTQMKQQYSMNNPYNSANKVSGNQNRYILPKDNPRVNYQPYNKYNSNQFNTVPLRNEPTLQKIASNQYYNNAEEEPLPRRSSQSGRSEELRKKNSNSVQKQRQGSFDNLGNINKKAEQREEQPHKMFRGLGYNIITNHKFSYDMENTRKDQTSKWLAY